MKTQNLWDAIANQIDFPYAETCPELEAIRAAPSPDYISIAPVEAEPPNPYSYHEDGVKIPLGRRFPAGKPRFKFGPYSEPLDD